MCILWDNLIRKLSIQSPSPLRKSALSPGPAIEELFVRLSLMEKIDGKFDHKLWSPAVFWGHHPGLEQKHAGAKLYWCSPWYTELPKCSTLRFDKPDPILLSDNNWNMQFCLLDTDKIPTGMIVSKVLMTQTNWIIAARAIWLILSIDEACF